MNKKISLLIVFILVGILQIAFAQTNNTATIKINNLNCYFESNIDSWVSNQKFEKDKNILVLLKASAVLTAEGKKQWQQSGIQILDYVPGNVYVAWVSASTQWYKIAHLQAVASFLPEFKIAASVAENAQRNKKVQLLVSFYQGVSEAERSSILLASGAQIKPSSWQKVGLYTIEIASIRLPSLVSNYAVQYVSEPSGNEPLDKDSKGLAAAVQIALPTYLGGMNLQAKGVTIGIGDNSTGLYHIDQKDRIVNYNNGDKDWHGVFVNGICAGDGIMDWAGQGVASDARILSYYFDAILPQKKAMFDAYKMTVVNNSYAAYVGNCSLAGRYDNLSQYLDDAAIENKQQLDVFAVGNDGRLVCGAYPSGFYNICGGFQASKNIITVGATNREMALADGSSRGPLRDGRIKPELVASGIDIMSTLPDNLYGLNRGTSFAAPQVSGVMALLVERFQQINAGALPRGDLMKAIVVNGATDMGRPGPDFWYGFGMLNAQRSLQMVENKRYISNVLNVGAPDQNFTITVPANTDQLKVMLYYHDPKATTIASTQLVNDLDLTVFEPGVIMPHLPLVLDATTTGVALDAVEGADHTNNIEQVTINNPVAGTYKVNVSAFNVPQGPQEYVVVYDFVPKEIKLKYPVANVSVADNSDMYIYWDAPNDASATTKIEFSADNGINWVTLAAALPVEQRFYKWSLPTLNSGQCKVRISQGAFTDISGSFVINSKPLLSLSPTQCPGSVAIDWSAVTGADKYYLLKKIGPHFQIVDSTSSITTHYVFKGLNTNELYYFSVQPVLNGLLGFRSNALAQTPSIGNCIGFTDGDLALKKINSPQSGRRSTSTELKKNTPIIVEVGNQDNDAVATYNISYQVNSAPWKTISAFSIAANTSKIQLVDTFDFSDTIEYELKIALTNKDKPDPITSNDTLIKKFRHWPNNIIALTAPLVNDFEMLPDMTLLADTIGFATNGYWDFNTNNRDTGRLRTTIPGSKLVTSAKSISLDVNINNKSTVNYLTGTFNLSNYDTSIDELRFDFDYEMRGMPVIKDSNKVWVRGSDLQSWVPIMSYSNSLDTGSMHHSGTISLREALRNNGQNFSTSTQIRFGQFDSTLIVDDNYGGGLTLDNINLYKVLKDVQMVRVVAPVSNDCDASATDVSVVVKNGTSIPVQGILLAYTLDGGSPVFASIDDTLRGDDSIVYTFPAGILSLSRGEHKLDVWLHSAGDDFALNDSILQYSFYNSPLITQYPYLQNFEEDRGDWYAYGRNCSWAHGIPNSSDIHSAASGIKAWKTNLNGTYNNNELSYLVSPCFATIGLSNPMLSFSMAYDIERCTAPCDRAHIEYSADNGVSWIRLGLPEKGTNWYSNTVHNAWNGTDTRWHVASYQLPRAWSLKLRFVMTSDMGTTYDGIAIDDIHIFDLQNPIATLGNNSEILGDKILGADTVWQSSLNAEQVVASVNARGNNLAAVNSWLYAQDTNFDAENNQYTIARSFKLIAENLPLSSVGLRLFVTDKEVNQIWADTSCVNCSKAADIYRMGITRYSRNRDETEDNSLSNDLDSNKKFYPFSMIKWVPYETGYYAELQTDRLGEFWFNDGGIMGVSPLNTNYLKLNARRWNDKEVELRWYSNLDTLTKNFSVLRSVDSIQFDEVAVVAAKNQHGYQYVYNDTPPIQQDQKVYYRIKGLTLNGKDFYSNTTDLLWTKGDQLLAVYPNPVTDGQLFFKWTAAIGSSLKYSLYDITGRRIFETAIVSQNWLNTSQVSLPFLSKGIYFLKIQIGAQQYQEKIIFK